MSDAKPYAMDDERIEHIRLHVAADADDARIVATVRALDAAQAERDMATLLSKKLREERDAAQAEVTALKSSVQSYSALVARNEEMRKQYATEDAHRIEQLQAEVTALREQLKSAEVTALRARVAELEALKEVDRAFYNLVVKERDAAWTLETALKAERDEWKARVADLEADCDKSQAAADEQQSLALKAESERDKWKARAEESAALATPGPAWLAERDRALAMKVARRVAAGAGRGAVLDVLLEPIVDSCLQEKP